MLSGGGFAETTTHQLPVLLLLQERPTALMPAAVVSNNPESRQNSSRPVTKIYTTLHVTTVSMHFPFELVRVPQ